MKTTIVTLFTALILIFTSCTKQDTPAPSKSVTTTTSKIDTNTYTINLIGISGPMNLQGSIQLTYISPIKNKAGNDSIIIETVYSTGSFFWSTGITANMKAPSNATYIDVYSSNSIINEQYHVQYLINNVLMKDTIINDINGVSFDAQTPNINNLVLQK